MTRPASSGWIYSGQSAVTEIGWNEAAGRFVDERGRFVSDARVRQVVDDIADTASARIAAASERLLAGELSLASWQVEVSRVLKDAHVASAVLAHGGAEQMTASRWGAIGPAVKEQYQFLRQFAEQLHDGRQPLTRQVVSRAEMYGQNARAQFERVRAAGQAARGYRSERNLLHAAESCASCKSEATKGWVPTGTLTPIGGRTCLSRCRCTISYRHEEAEAA